MPLKLNLCCAVARSRLHPTPELLRALRQYFCKQDYTSYDFKLAKVANVKSTAYQKLVQYFVPAEARFVQNFIETQMYNPGPLFADAVVDTDGPAFYTNTKWDTLVQINARKFFEEISQHITTDRVKYDVVTDYAKLMDIVTRAA